MTVPTEDTPQRNVSIIRRKKKMNFFNDKIIIIEMITFEKCIYIAKVTYLSCIYIYGSKLSLLYFCFL